MSDPHGTPIWYELASADPDASQAFYEAVIGWRVGPQPPDGVDYRTIDTGYGQIGGQIGGQVGGLMRLTDAMRAGGGTPGWTFYIGVDDVDLTAARVADAGGAVQLAPFDIPGAGRAALVADPQGLAFYVMRGASETDGRAYDRTGLGKCNWNELLTADQAAAHAFYGDLFGWTFPHAMAMPGGMGDYVFVHAGAAAIGATMTARPGGDPPGWRFYFRAPDIAAAAQAVRANGGTVRMGPQEVPGGDRIIVAADPHGVVFGIVGPGNGEHA